MDTSDMNEGQPSAEVQATTLAQLAANRFPSGWNQKDRNTAMELSRQNCRVAYKGAGKSEADAAAVRANNGIPSQCGVYYYEVEIISKGRDGYIGVGFCTQNASLNRLPGWEQQSYGYQGEDGYSFAQSGIGNSYGPTFSTGDVIGCGINFIENTAFFTKNGISLGTAFKDLRLHTHPIFPSVGMRTPGEIIEANFGQKPFLYDIDSYKKEVKGKLIRNVVKMDLTSFGSHTMVNSLIQSYLIHHGYAETAKVFAKSQGSGILDNMDVDDNLKENNLNNQLASIQKRREIKESIMSGEIVKGIELTQLHYPNVLQKNQKLMFLLRCAIFVELVRKGSASKDTDWLDEAMSVGQKLQDMYGSTNDEEQKAKLEMTFSLLAYSNPFNSPVSHLLDISARDSVASALNSAILVDQNESAIPALERVVNQSVVLLQELKNHGLAPSFLDIQNDFINNNNNSNNNSNNNNNVF